MMDCDATRERLFAWLDSEAAAEEREAIEQHLAACPTCALEGLALLRTRRLVADSVRVEAPPGSLAGIRARAEAAGLIASSCTTIGWRTSRRLPLWASAAAAVGAALLAWWVAPREERIVEKSVLLAPDVRPAGEAPPAPAAPSTPPILSAREVNASLWSSSPDRPARRTARRREERQDPIRSVWTRK
ncbi:MAG: zf-HC2 domain-containing protein [Planctomycetes bacterium]|nr:zf-HC2 domain-containing protein [Planctomycetota bacterium]